MFDFLSNTSVRTYVFLVLDLFTIGLLIPTLFYVARFSAVLKKYGNLFRQAMEPYSEIRLDLVAQTRALQSIWRTLDQRTELMTSIDTRTFFASMESEKAAKALDRISKQLDDFRILTVALKTETTHILSDMEARIVEKLGDEQAFAIRVSDALRHGAVQPRQTPPENSRTVPLEPNPVIPTAVNPQALGPSQGDPN
jgi:hypothetical protein